MARSESIINVFVASPSDVNEERKTLESVISELNRTWSQKLKLRLELIKRETDTYPSFGEYPQDVINQQIDDRYDVFIALFWSKIGSPTPIADSGTIEELNRAYTKYTSDPDSVEIMVYFKDEGIPPSQMDSEQLQKLQDIKSRLGEQGGLYWSFDNTEDFEPLVRGHLSKVAQAWSNKLSDMGKTQVNPTIVPAEIKKDEDEEYDYDLLDYVDIYTDRMRDMVISLTSMAGATKNVGAQFSRRTEEIKNVRNHTDGSVDNIFAKKMLKLISDDLNIYSDLIDSQVKISNLSRTEAFHALSKAISISFELENEDDDTNGLEKALIELIKSAKFTQSGIMTFKVRIEDLPRLTIQMKKAKRKAAQSLDAVLDETRRMIQSAEDVLKTIISIKKNKT